MLSLAPTLPELSKLDAPKAYRAARALFANPNDLPQVFTLLQSTAGASFPWLVARMKASAKGRELLANQPDIVDVLADRERLRAMPEGSLGRAYLAFVESEGISADGIREASEQGREATVEFTAEEDFVRRRMRDTHDVWHAIAGYKGDVLGELALLAFTYAQARNVGILIMIALGLVKLRHVPGARALILDGFRRGARAAWLPEQPLETMLEEPVERVRTRLLIDAPPVYDPIRIPSPGAATAMAA